MKERLRALQETRAWQISASLVARAQRSNFTLLAAALAFFAAFSLSPLLLLLAGGFGYALRNRPELAAQLQRVLTDLVSQIMPLEEEEARIALIEQSFDAILLLLQEGAELRAVISVIVLVWASSNFFTSLQFAIELIFASPQPRNLVNKRLVSLLLVVLVMAVIFIEVVVSFVLASLQGILDVVSRTLVPPDGTPLLPPLPDLEFVTLARIVVAIVAFTLCFRVLPRRASTWTGALSGATFSTLSIVLARELLQFGFNVDRFNLVYGVITSLLFVLLWLYVTMLLFLGGALIAAEISSRRRDAETRAR
jgi:membrane protein